MKNQYTIEFPDSLIDSIYSELHSLGFKICLIGGGARNIIQGLAVPKDLDFEVISTLGSNNESHEKWKQWSQRVESTYSAELLPFEIVRIKIGDFDLEFAPPRIEKYKKERVFGHSSFDAEINFLLSDEQAALRRDLTINSFSFVLESMGSRPNQYRGFVRDPFGGIEDLKNQRLKAVGDCFPNDPVRLLRLIRFEQELNFQIERDTLEKFRSKNLEKLSSFYFSKESYACDFYQFMKTFFQLVNQLNITINKQIQDLSFLKDVSSDWRPANCRETFVTLVGNNVNSDNLEKFRAYFQIPKKWASKIVKLFDQKNDIDYRQIVDKDLAPVVKHYLVSCHSS